MLPETFCMDRTEKPKPVAQGNFSKTPFAHILVYLLERKMGGTLEIRDNENEATIYFREGMPVKVRSSFSGRDFGSVLRMLKLVNDEQIAAAKEEIKEKNGLMGLTLVHQGAINAQTLVKGLQKQTLLKLTDVFSMTSASYAFYDKINMLVGFGPDELVPIDTFSLLMAGLRTHGGRYNLRALCSKLEGKWIMTEGIDALRRFQMNPQERDMVEELLDYPRSYDKLVASERHNQQMVTYVLYALMITKLLDIQDEAPDMSDVDEEQLRPSQLESMTPLHPAGPEDPAVAKKKEIILAKAESIAAENYYERLGLPFGAQAKDVQTAFFRMAKEFHPDKVPTEIALDMKDTLLYIFSNLSEARATLVDSEAREEYEAAIKSGEKIPNEKKESEEDKVRAILQAEDLFQKAQVLLRRNELDQAEKLIEKSKELNPNEGEYLALWAHIKGRSSTSDEELNEVISALRRATDLNPKSEKVNLYFAQVMKRVGNFKKAESLYRKVLEANQKNIEAARELRLLDLRKKKGSVKDKVKERTSNFFKRWFEVD
jgi:tetratricopeptide (TPR) repeat protein